MILGMLLASFMNSELLHINLAIPTLKRGALLQQQLVVFPPSCLLSFEQTSDH